MQNEDNRQDTTTQQQAINLIQKKQIHRYLLNTQWSGHIFQFRKFLIRPSVYLKLLLQSYCLYLDTGQLHHGHYYRMVMEDGTLSRRRGQRQVCA